MVGSTFNPTKIWPDEAQAYNLTELAAYPAFLSTDDRVRLEKIRQGRALFDGRHESFFFDEGRTQFSYRQVRTARGTRTLYIPCNVLRLVSMKAADLLLGGAPAFTVADSSAHADAIERLADRCGLHQVLYQGAVDASVESDCYFEGVLFDNEVYVQQVDGAEMFPVGRIMPDGQHAAYLRRQVENVGTTETPIWLLLETTYRAGAIERHCWQLSGGQAGLAKQKEVALDQWPAFKPAGSDKTAIAPPQIQRTGIAWNTIVWIPNLVVRKRPVSDYDGGVVSMQDSLNAKTSQFALVILKHAQPKLILPEALGTATPSEEVYYQREGDIDAKYLTWEAQLEAADKDRVFTLGQILVQTETSPVLLGMKEGAAPEKYQSLRLQAFNSISKAARRAVYWTEGVRTILTVASMLEQTIPGNRYDMGAIGVELRDGIPVDAEARANELSMLRSAGLKSVKKGLRELLGDDTAAEEEEAELGRERAAATPSILLGSGMSGIEPGEINETTAGVGGGAGAGREAA